MERGGTVQLLLRGPEIADEEFFLALQESGNPLKPFWVQAQKDIDLGNCFVVDISLWGLIANFIFVLLWPFVALKTVTMELTFFVQQSDSFLSLT